ncbi:MAG: hypothetical protein EOM91_21830 [Sphingobacteriia bacterium]|nr:hypothetical protein [Sphingobacteriia bacterium]
MGPLCVRFRLVTPMRSPEQPIHLDALLAWAAVEAAHGDLGAQDRLPLERYTGADGRWVWKASRVFIPVVARGREPMIRSFEPWNWGDDKGTVYLDSPNNLKAGTGPFKGHLFGVSTLQAEAAYAWCVGDRAQIAELLVRVTNLGKLRRLDFGRIAQITVAEDPDALERWQVRALPDERPGYRTSLQTLRPPYFDRALREPAWEPPAALVAKITKSVAGDRPQAPTPR